MTSTPPVRVALALVAVALVGAFAFGLWHFVVGGFVNGNPRAGQFGAVLAAVAGGLLIGLRGISRRRR